MFFLLPGGEKAQGLHPGHGACVLSPVPGHAGQDAVGAAAYSCLNPSTKKVSYKDAFVGLLKRFSLISKQYVGFLSHTAWLF
jgi:hypothetical protein